MYNIPLLLLAVNRSASDSESTFVQTDLCPSSSFCQCHAKIAMHAKSCTKIIVHVKNQTPTFSFSPRMHNTEWSVGLNYT